MAHVGTEIGCLLVVVFDIGTLTIQYVLLNSLYRSVPELSMKIVTSIGDDVKCRLPDRKKTFQNYIYSPRHFFNRRN